MRVLVRTVKAETEPQEWIIPAGIDGDSLNKLIWAYKREYSMNNFTVAAQIVLDPEDREKAAQASLELAARLDEAAEALGLPQVQVSA